MGWHLIQNKENYMKKKDLILAGAVLLLAGILALALRLPKTENGNTIESHGGRRGLRNVFTRRKSDRENSDGSRNECPGDPKTEVSIWKKLTARTATAKTGYDFPGK